MSAVMAASGFREEGTAWLDDDGIGGGPMTEGARKNAAGASPSTSPALPRSARMMNANLSSTFGACWTAFRQVFGAGMAILFNAGAMRVVSIDVPEGCFLNPRPPASVHARIITAYRVHDALMDAFSKVVPDKVIAPGFNSSICLALSRLDQGKYSIFVEVLSGGWGGRAGSDGPDALPFPLSNCSNAPAEYVESQFPFLRIRRYGLVPDSGAGEARRLGSARLRHPGR
jgi:N-methylhydantoinase B